MLRKFALALALGIYGLLLFASAAPAQEAVMWEPVNIQQRDLYLGPGGAAMRPNIRRVTFVERERGGNNLKFRIKDANGRVWVAKIADESRPEVAAARILWGVGYKTEINYLVPRMTIPTRGAYNNVSLEARPADIDRGERWDWENNPFIGSHELQGLKILMAMINNWDLKKDNTAILKVGDRQHYIVSDLGASFGKLAFTSGFFLNRFGRSVDQPVAFAKSKFINKVTNDGFVEFAYNSAHSGLMRDITVEDARWLAGLLGQLSDRQLNDAFRAANYTASERRVLVNAMRGRIRELQRVGNGNLAIR